MKNTKLKPRDLQIILVVLGVLALFCSYRFVYSSFNTSAEQLKTENDELKARCDDLQDKKENQIKYEAEIERDEKDTKEILDKFSQARKTEEFDTEGNIEYLIKLMKKTGMKIMNLSYEPVGVFYNFSGEETGGATVSATKVVCGFKISYKGLRQMVKLVNKEYKRMKMEDINCSADDSSGGLTGTLTFSAYTSDSSEVGKKYKKPDFKVKTGRNGKVFVTNNN